MTTLLLTMDGEARELAMVDDISEVPAFASSEAEHAFWATHWASPRLIEQMQRADRFAAEIGRD